MKSRLATKIRVELVEGEPRMSPGDAGCGCHPAPYIRKGFRSGAGLEEGRSSPVVPGQQAPENVTKTAEVTDMAAVNEFFSRFGCPFQEFREQAFPCCLPADQGSQGTHHSVDG